MVLKVKASDIEQKVTQGDSHSLAQVPLASEYIRCVSPMTFSQKLYQTDELEIAEELEQALEANSLEKLKMLLDKVLEVDERS